MPQADQRRMVVPQEHALQRLLDHRTAALDVAVGAGREDLRVALAGETMASKMPQAVLFLAIE